MSVVPRRSALAGLAAALATTRRVRAQEGRPQRLSIGLLPGESAPTVLRLNENLRTYLARTLRVEVALEVGSTYAATGEALRFGRIDIAYLGPVTYVLQHERAPLVPFARPSHPGVGAVFEAALIVPAGSPAARLADLHGTDIAFGDPASTSGTWVPQYELLQAGLMAGRDYRDHYLGAHDAVALAVANRKVAAGGVSRPVYDRLLTEGKVDRDKVRVLAASRPIPEYAFTFRSGLDFAFQAEIAAAFLAMDDPAVLTVFTADRFVPAADGDFAAVRTWVAALRAAKAAG